MEYIVIKLGHSVLNIITINFILNMSSVLYILYYEIIFVLFTKVHIRI